MELALSNTEWDIYLDASGNIAVLEEPSELLAQRIRHRLQTFRGECFLDRDVGVPYYSEILRKNPDLSRVRSLLASVISAVPGVVKILSLNLDFKRKSRELSVSFRVQGEGETIAEGRV